jgi:hypothetical protein
MRMPAGRVERANYARPGHYLFPGAVLDTRNLVVRRFAATESQDALDAIPPLALSPDERSFAVLAYADGARDTHALKVTDIQTRQAYALPLDKAAMRYTRPEQLDPAWVDHYFAWERGPAGTDRLVARAGVAPLPYRGTLSAERSSYREYRVAPAQPSLRTALGDFMVKEFNGERVPGPAEAYAHEVRIAGRVISIGYGKEDREIVLFTDRNGDAQIVAAIAQKFDAALATGAYDSHFVQ